MDKPIPEAVELLRAFQSQFGARRPDEDEDDAETWDRIDAVCKALTAAQQQGQPTPPSAPVGVEELVKLLERIRDLLASLPADCLGSGTDASGQPYPIRDEVIHGITKALAQQPAAGAVDKVRFRKAPCYLCGYNGPGYYHPDTHPCAAKYHATQHQEPTT